MTFASVIRNIEKSPLTAELIQKLEKNGNLTLTGLARLPKGLISTAFARCQGKNLLIICANLEEAARWAAQLVFSFIPPRKLAPTRHLIGNPR